jgi:endonuclease YncB( thermonuclease family)
MLVSPDAYGMFGSSIVPVRRERGATERAPIPSPPTPGNAELEKLESEAREAKKGLWVDPA